MIRAMDLTLGAPGLLLDEDNRRRELYGKAGACRPKMYGDIPGVEWRTSSNWWVKERKYMEWTFSGAQLALEMKDEIDWDKMEVLRQAINTGDRKTAEALIKYFKIPMP